MTPSEQAAKEAIPDSPSCMDAIPDTWEKFQELERSRFVQGWEAAKRKIAEQMTDSDVREATYWNKALQTVLNNL